MVEEGGGVIGDTVASDNVVLGSIVVGHTNKVHSLAPGSVISKIHTQPPHRDQSSQTTGTLPSHL